MLKMKWVDKFDHELMRLNDFRLQSYGEGVFHTSFWDIRHVFVTNGKGCVINGENGDEWLVVTKSVCPTSVNRHGAHGLTDMEHVG